jgi:predicted transcriptional regulator
MTRMAMTLRLSDEESAALRQRAEAEGRSMQEVARAAVREYVQARDQAARIDAILDEQLPRYADALRRLGE